MKALVVSLIVAAIVVVFELCAFVLAGREDRRSGWK